MSAFIVYDAASGRILRTGTASESQAARQADAAAGERLLLELTADDVTEYIEVVAGQVLARPAMGALADTLTIAGNGVAVCMVTQIPPGVMARVTGGGTHTEVPVEDGWAAITIDAPGRFQLTLSGFPQLPQTFEITAT